MKIDGILLQTDEKKNKQKQISFICKSQNYIMGWNNMEIHNIYSKY